MAFVARTVLASEPSAPTERLLFLNGIENVAAIEKRFSQFDCVLYVDMQPLR